MNFGKGIFIAFVLFAIFIGSLVYVCVTQSVPLVSRNYYQEELKHEVKMTQIQNANQLPNRPSISFNNGNIQVAFDRWNLVEKGQLKVMRPSDSSLDEIFSLTANKSTEQSFALHQWKKGLYRISMTWEMEGKEFYVERILVL